MKPAPAAGNVHDPFIKLTHIYTKEGGHWNSPIFILPDKVREIYNGRVHVEGGYSFDVLEQAGPIHTLVINKLAENREADTMGKS